MNSLERVSAAVDFKETDRVPVIAQVFGHAATLSSVPLADYVRDGETLAKCQLKALNQYGYDAVFSVMDVSVETEAAGSVLRYPKNNYPLVEKYAFSTCGDWDGFSIPDPLKDGRMPEMLRALEVLRRETGGETLVVGCVMGPFTLTTQLLGMEDALYLAVDDAPRLERLMDFATETIIRFGKAQLKAGAHLPIVFNPSASPAVIPPQFFREFELPRLGRIFEAFKESGSLANWLHIAGPVGPILPYYKTAGVNIANVDYCISPETAMEELHAVCIDGNIKPVAFVDESPGDIESEAMNLLGAFKKRGGFILSSGCEIPPESRPENIAAMVNSVRTR
ncbi:MAG: uroporphyrinogen decarboxylase family protein [Nitrospirota bacterium]